VRVKPVVSIAVGLAIAVTAAMIVLKKRQPSVTLTGVVLRQDPDPRRQLPIANVKVTATEGSVSAATNSEISGLFHLNLPREGWRDQPVTLAFRHADFLPVTIERSINGDLYIVRMKPIVVPPAIPVPPEVAPKDVAVKDVRIRYTERTITTVNVGSTAKTFTVPNSGDVPCDGKPPCSPDGKWKAAFGGITLDAGEGQEFTQARIACIAGPCPFTRIESGTNPAPGRIVQIRVRNWSDMVTFLVEAEVTRIMPSNAARRAYPAIYGHAMSFTLPLTAEGPAIEADLDGSEIVFPLGPALQLSWADCTLQTSADQAKLYRCELKPGYVFH
jgi:hypothetical protein